MVKITEKLNIIKTAKDGIKTAIENKGVTVGDISISDYAEKINSIETGGGDGLDDYFKMVGTSTDTTFVYYIKKIPSIDTSNLTNMVNFFEDFRSITEIPQLDTSNVTNMNSIFRYCTSLQRIPLLNISKNVNTSYMFYMDGELIEIPQLDTSSVINATQMFYGCVKLPSIPELNASKVTYISNCFTNCYELVDFGGFKDIGKAYLTSQSANYSQYTLSLSDCKKLTHDSLMNVINGLYDIASAGIQTQKLVLGSTNTAKLTADEIAIATNKGWVVS
jgi:hypothetical protein